MEDTQRREILPNGRPPQAALSLAEFWSRLDPDADRFQTRAPAGANNANANSSPRRRGVKLA